MGHARVVNRLCCKKCNFLAIKTLRCTGEGRAHETMSSKRLPLFSFHLVKRQLDGLLFSLFPSRNVNCTFLGRFLFRFLWFFFSHKKAQASKRQNSMGFLALLEKNNRAVFQCRAWCARGAMTPQRAPIPKSYFRAQVWNKAFLNELSQHNIVVCFLFQVSEWRLLSGARGH